MENNMNENEMKSILIDEYVNLERIKVAKDKDKEVEYQQTLIKAKLQSYGVTTEDLSIK